MPDALAYQKRTAAKLLEAVAIELRNVRAPGVPAPDPDALYAEATVVALARLIGEAVACFPPGEPRQAMKRALVPLLGQPVGMLLKGMSDLHASAALEGHAQILATTMGATPFVSISVETNTSLHPAPKVMQ